MTTTHRVNFTCEEWMQIFKSRGINVYAISKVNQLTSLSLMPNRRKEIEAWVINEGSSSNYLVIDDDPSLFEAPAGILNRCVITQFATGLNDTATTAALKLIHQQLT